MKNLKKFILILIISTQAIAHKHNQESELKTEAITIVKKFAGQLKPQLKQAIGSGGFEHAVNICSVQAPQIAHQLSKDSGWSIKRVSLKPRNSSALADEYELKVLQQFEEEQANGESNLMHSEIVENQYRFMKAQVVEGLCLNCHGSSVSKEVQDTLKKHYPNDSAIGYNLGQVRGAFSLVKGLD